MCIPRESEGLLESSNRDSLGTQEEEGESDKLVQWNLPMFNLGCPYSHCLSWACWLGRSGQLRAGSSEV